MPTAQTAPAGKHTADASAPPGPGACEARFASTAARPTARQIGSRENPAKIASLPFAAAGILAAKSRLKIIVVGHERSPEQMLRAEHAAFRHL
jgi:hypothetical protein